MIGKYCKYPTHLRLSKSICNVIFENLSGLSIYQKTQTLQLLKLILWVDCGNFKCDYANINDNEIGILNTIYIPLWKALTDDGKYGGKYNKYNILAVMFIVSKNSVSGDLVPFPDCYKLPQLRVCGLGGKIWCHIDPQYRWIVFSLSNNLKSQV